MYLVCFFLVKEDADVSPSSAETLMLPGRGEEEPTRQEPNHVDVTATPETEKGQAAASTAAETRDMPEKEHGG